jgi:outer membrane protein assembly factor BamB
MNRLTKGIGHWSVVAGVVGIVAGLTLTCWAADPVGPRRGSRRPVVTTTGMDLRLSPKAAAALGYRFRWSAQAFLGKDAGSTEVAVLGDLIVGVEEPENLVTAISLADGKIVWQRVVGSPSDRLFMPARRGDQILVNSESALYVLRAENGELERLIPLDEMASSGPTLVKNRAVFGTINHRVLAIDLGGGYRVWSFLMSDGIVAPPVATGSSVFVADGKGKYVMLASESGQLEWEGKAFGRVSAEPTVTPAAVLVPSEDYSLYALNRASGQGLWAYRTTHPLRKRAHDLGYAVCLPVPTGGLVGIDPRTGQELWRIEDAVEAVAEQDETLLIRTTQGLALVDPASGQKLVEAMAPMLDRVLSGPQGSLILVFRDGRLMRLNRVNP